MLSPDEQSQLAALTATVNVLAERVAWLEAQVGGNVRADAGDGRRRKRYTQVELDGIAGNLIGLANQWQGEIPSDGVIADRLGVKRTAFNGWKNHPDHTVGRTYAAIVKTFGQQRSPVMVKHSRKDRIAAMRFTQRLKSESDE